MDRRKTTRHPALRQLLQDVRNSLVHLRKSGCSGFDCSPQTIQTIADLRAQPAVERLTKERLADIRADLGDCKRCPLWRTRSRIVFGEGSDTARLVFVGEGPGFEEDRSGRPFVGKAGELLTNIIRAMHLTRDQVYIANIVKCRPPNNRNPRPEEIRRCLPFLQRQLAAIDPQIICTLGNVAARTILQTESSISKLRGSFHDLQGRLVMPTFHPAYLLRNPERKRDVWHDVQQIMKRLALV